MKRKSTRWAVLVGAVAAVGLWTTGATAGQLLNRCGQSAQGGLYVSMLQQNGTCTGCVVKTAADEEARPLFRRVPVWSRRDLTPESGTVKKVYAFVVGDYASGVLVDRDQDLEAVAAPGGRCVLRAAADVATNTVVR